MADIKTLNGYNLADTKAREDIATLTEEIAKHKYASAFGFSPDAGGDTNSAALQSAVDGGGTIIVDVPGVYDVSKSCAIGSNTTLLFGAGVYLNRVTNAEGVTARFPFYNANMRDRTGNENIRIEGLHLITNGLGMGEDIANVPGMRGQLAFSYVKNLTISGFEILDGTSGMMYNIHVQVFENIALDNIKIVSQKDGIHLSCGSGFVIRNVELLTNDDGIALNAHDYPTNLRKYGWVENGIVENVYFVGSDEYRTGRGLYMLGGSWKDWESGMSVRKYGDACVSDGRIYRTLGDLDPDKGEIISTVQPTHTSGTQTYSDGVTWFMAQNGDVIYDCGVRNVVFRDIRFGRASSAALTINLDDDAYSRSYYPGSTAPVFENITVQNLHMDSGKVARLLDSYAPTRNIRFRDCTYNATARFADYRGTYDCVNFGDDSLLIDGAYYNFDSINSQDFIKTESNRPVKVKIANSFGNYDLYTPYATVGVTFEANDINAVATVNLWDVSERTLIRHSFSATKDSVPNYEVELNEYILTGSRSGYISGGNPTECEVNNNNITYTVPESGVGLFMPVDLEPGATYRLQYTVDNQYGAMAFSWYDADKKYIANSGMLSPNSNLTYDGTFTAQDYPNFVLTANANNSDASLLPETITFSNVSLVKVS